MDESYLHRAIEVRWQARWEEEGIFEVAEPVEGRRAYVLEMFPYPSGDLHMGHIRVYTIGDVLARFRRARGEVVLHPMGWDALGLPAENAAIRDGVHPAVRTRGNIEKVRAQMKAMGWGYAWSREVATCDPEYYRWNQWFFLKMLERDLVYRRTDSAVNWCGSCETVIANEQARDGVCERCGSEVEARTMPEWAFRITRYAHELLEDLDGLERWPDSIKTQQRNWIGRSYGAEVDFAVEGAAPIRVFTTRVDTIYGCTFMVLAPEHPRVMELVTPDRRQDVEVFVRSAAAKSKVVRSGSESSKRGVFLGSFAINPYNGEAVPIWIADFVLADYGTGAVMSVPAHDARDFAFATEHGIPIRVVIEPEQSAHDGSAPEEAFEGDGFMIDSGEHSGLRSNEGRRVLAERAEAGGFGKTAISYHLRDWGFSRQRYWGTPIPVVMCDDCGTVPVPFEELPILLPEGVEVTGCGGAPLAHVEDFVNTACPSCGGHARREVETMDTFVDSAWYFARYLDAHNDEEPFSREAADRWLPVDLYVGGPEHAVMHLLYFRFWTKVMRDMGLVGLSEPVDRLLVQGMVTNWSSRCPTHGYIRAAELAGTDEAPKCPTCGGEVERKLEKMSKTKLNGVAPDALIDAFGADAMRLFILFAAPPGRDLMWSDQGPEGAFRFLRRLHDLMARHCVAIDGGAAESLEVNPDALTEDGKKLWRKVHRTIAKVTDDIERTCQLNTAVAALMELRNEAAGFEPRADADDDRALVVLVAGTFARLLGPFAPHLAEEIWHSLGHEVSVLGGGWPEHDPAAIVEEAVTVAVQVNGKVRAEVTVAADASDGDVRCLALAQDGVVRQLDGKEPRRVIVVRAKGGDGPPQLVSVVR